LFDHGSHAAREWFPAVFAGGENGFAEAKVGFFGTRPPGRESTRLLKSQAGL